jgi:hypothetical protein
LQSSWLDIVFQCIFNNGVNVDFFLFLLCLSLGYFSFIFLKWICSTTIGWRTKMLLTISNSLSRSSYSTFSSTSSNPPAKAPHRSGLGQCQISMLPWFVVEAMDDFLGCHYCSMAIRFSCWV